MVKSFRYLMLSVPVYLAGIAIFAAVVTVGAFLTGVPRGADGLFRTYYTAFPLMILMMLFLFSFSFTTHTLNLAISFGARREDFFWAVQGAMVVCALVCTLIQIVLSAIPHLTGWTNIDRVLLLFVGDLSFWLLPLVFLCIQPVGAVTGLLFVRSRLWGMVVMVAAILLGILATGLLLLSSDFGVGLWGDLPLILMAVLVAAAVVSDWFIWRLVRNYCVK